MVVQNQTHYPITFFYNDINNNNTYLTFIGYNYDDKAIVFIVNRKEINSTKAKPYVGICTPLGI